MANTTNPLDIYQSLAAFDIQFDEEFVRAKIDPPGKEVSRDQIFKRDGQILGNLQDDAVRRLVKSIQRRSFDNRQAIAAALREPDSAALISTASIPNAGGTGDFTLPARIASGTFQWVRLVSVGGASALVNLEFFADAARSIRVLEYTGIDPSTAFVDGNPTTIVGEDGSDLEARLLYARITNNGAAASVFELEAVLEGI